MEVLITLTQIFLSWQSENRFDVVCFFLTLHHFTEPRTIIEKISRSLNPKGRIIVVEPARDLFSRQNAVLVALIRILLSKAGMWYQDITIPNTIEDLELVVDEYLNEYREAKDKNEAEQSPNDNSTFAKDMLEVLNHYFDQEELTFGNSITPRMVGGIRGKSEEETLEIARFIKLFDEFATEREFLQPGVIYYSGTKNKKSFYDFDNQY
ncbi:MAG: methyltransferase domain-containing protein [Saprospiraceae bacterium]|nr:methyltransferase domain-containing protein [Saprospiraceae bacterium]